MNVFYKNRGTLLTGFSTEKTEERFISVII